MAIVGGRGDRAAAARVRGRGDRVEPESSSMAVVASGESGERGVPTSEAAPR